MSGRRSSAKRSAKEPRHIRSAIERVLEGLGLEKVVEQHTVYSEWSERVGQEIARAAKPYRVDGDTLIVRVANSAWINELSLRQNELLGRLNAGRSKSKIKRLIFRLDPEERD